MPEPVGNERDRDARCPATLEAVSERGEDCLLCGRPAIEHDSELVAAPVPVREGEPETHGEAKATVDHFRCPGCNYLHETERDAETFSSPGVLECPRCELVDLICVETSVIPVPSPVDYLRAVTERDEALARCQMVEAINRRPAVSPVNGGEPETQGETVEPLFPQTPDALAKEFYADARRVRAGAADGGSEKYDNGYVDALESAASRVQTLGLTLEDAAVSPGHGERQQIRRYDVWATTTGDVETVGKKDGPFVYFSDHEAAIKSALAVSPVSGGDGSTFSGDDPKVLRRTITRQQERLIAYENRDVGAFGELEALKARIECGIREAKDRLDRETDAAQKLRDQSDENWDYEHSAAAHLRSACYAAERIDAFRSLLSPVCDEQEDQG